MAPTSSDTIIIPIERPIDWNKLRDEFFNECTDGINEVGFIRINTTPHNLFEWFKKKIEKLN